MATGNWASSPKPAQLHAVPEVGGGCVMAPPPRGAAPASSAELGAPGISEKPPFHGLIEYLNNPFIPARHKECCPNSGDSGRRPRAQWPLEWAAIQAAFCWRGAVGKLQTLKGMLPPLPQWESGNRMLGQSIKLRLSPPRNNASRAHLHKHRDCQERGTNFN